jgi:hypothetical protein
LPWRGRIPSRSGKSSRTCPTRHHCRIRLELQSGENHRPLNVAADAEYDEDIDLLSLEINSYGYRWLRLNHTPWT